MQQFLKLKFYIKFEIILLLYSIEFLWKLYFWRIFLKKTKKRNKSQEVNKSLEIIFKWKKKFLHLLCGNYLWLNLFNDKPEYASKGYKACTSAHRVQRITILDYRSSFWSYHPVVYFGEFQTKTSILNLRIYSFWRFCDAVN